ncbi:serine/threonine protein kinase [Anabaena sp. UHCC 0253]|uniref:serine/threonine-protein kinase n=1 Tax=Anabaena sp. UHCC 0253 TaxID=2590019 RepID=UPI0014471E5D|nr:serine/threonine-protein kinase [Anabaena sp. UHCC 0253]MTJ52242.1 serine/threonine protein kinase [Anabaena sp. UHCC 0253]
MSLCINPNCPKSQNPDNILFCEACGSELLLEGRYRVIRQLGEGGFGKTFEISQNNTLKVLKVLTLDDPKAVSLFQQEARVLSQLNHPGIPKAEVYFTFLPRNSQSPLHCLVMEKIEGLDLSQYMEQRENRPIDEKLAILWLTQLANILNEVHKQNFFHRDIKPSNIMLKADGHLALIDFGTAREVTKTYYQKAAGQNITGIISPGYTPLEQANGNAVPQSDFFALGRTFIYLLTGKSPDEFSEDSQTGKLIWRDSASQVSKPLAGLIDYLSEPFSGKRPQNAEMILRCISDINNLSYLSSTSASTVPSTLVKPPQQHTQHKTVSTSQQQSSKNQKNELSQQIYQGIGTLIGAALLIFFRLGWKDIGKIFQPPASQPVAISQPTEIQDNNSELVTSNPNIQETYIDNSQEAEIKAVFAQNLRGLNEENLDITMSVIDESIPEYEQTRNMTQQIFYTYDLRYEINTLEVTEISENYAKVMITQITTKIAGPAFRDNILVVTHTLKKSNNGQWKIILTKVEDIKYLN